MDGTAALIIQAVIGLGTVGGTVGVISRWAGRLDARLGGVEKLAAEAMPRVEHAAGDRGLDSRFGLVEDRVETLEEHVILPREVEAMQNAYKEALTTLTGNIDKRFTAMDGRFSGMETRFDNLSRQVLSRE